MELSCYGIIDSRVKDRKYDTHHVGFDILRLAEELEMNGKKVLTFRRIGWTREFSGIADFIERHDRDAEASEKEIHGATIETS